MKKVFRTLVAVALVVSLLILAGCSGQSSQTTTTASSASSSTTTAASSGSTTAAEIKPFKVGFPLTTVTTSPYIVELLNNVRTAVEAAGGELIVTDWDFTPDALVTQVQKLISMDVDGLMLLSTADTILPNINDMCVEANIPFAMINSINDASVKEILEASPMYAGASYEVDSDIAYESIKKMSEMGVKNLVVANNPQGDTFGDNRDVGIKKGCEEFGIKLLAEPRGLTSAEAVTKAFESCVAAYPEMDGIFLAASQTQDLLPTVMKVLSDHNLIGKVKVGRIDTDPYMADYIGEGGLSFVYGVQGEIKCMVAACLLVNKIIGSPVSDKPVIVPVGLTFIQSKEDIDKYNKFFMGETPIYTTEEIKDLFLKHFNPDVTADSIKEIAANFSIDDVVKRHADLVK